MRAQTTTTRPRRKTRHVFLALALSVCALAIPASATAEPIDSHYASVPAFSDGSEGSSEPQHSGDYSSVNSIAPPASASDGSQTGDSGYSSLNSISGAPAETPTFASSPTGSSDGFDWPSALVGAGAALAMAALGTAALLTVRRRTATSPSA